MAAASFETENQDVNSRQGVLLEKSKEYVLSYHESECERLKLQHQFLKKQMQGNFSAPVHAELQKGAKVLDAACGTGVWTCEMAQTYPASMFHGIDLNPVFPQTNVPANIKFGVAKLGEPLPFPDNTFQFIHQRLVAIALKTDDWDRTLKEHFRILQPGGWLELNESDLEMSNMGPKTHSLIHTYLQVTRSRNLLPLVARELKERLEKLQMQNVTEICVEISMQDDADGQTTLWDCLSPVFHNMQSYLSQINAAFKDDDYFAQFLKDIGDEGREHKTTLRMYRVYGQKPANQWNIK